MIIVTPLTPEPMTPDSEVPMANVTEVNYRPVKLYEITPGTSLRSDTGKTAVVRSVGPEGVSVYIDGMRDMIMECQLYHWYLY